MAKRSLFIWIFLVMLLMFLAVYGCNNSNTTQPNVTSSLPTDTLTTSATSITTNPTGNILEFEDFFIYLSLKDQDIPTQIHLMISNDSPLSPAIDQISAEAQTKLDVVDFSKDFILFAFMGYQGVTGPTIEITKIWQINNTIYVEAYFDKGGPTYQPASSSPVNIVKVSKENMTQFGEITFILIDQYGEERARTTCEIPE